MTTQLGSNARRFAAIIAVGGCISTTSIAQAAIIYVDDSAHGFNDGSEWQHAFTRLRPALLAAQPGDEVRIAQGSYCPAQPGQPRQRTFVIPQRVSVVGGFAGDGAFDPDDFDPETYITTLTGDINGDDGPNFANYGDNCLHVVTIIGGGRSTILRGVTVSGGNANGSSGGSIPGNAGAGIIVRDAGTPSILECFIELNQAAFSGAALHAPFGGVLLRRCNVQDNQTTLDDSIGGGLVLGDGSRVQRCRFSSNTTGRSGGAIIGSGITFTNSDFEDNAAGEFGGAITGNDLDFTDCTFTGNAAEHGGAVRCANSSFTNCDFENNTAQRRGGAVLAAGTLTFDDCTFTLNSALVGGAVDVRGVSQVIKCLFDRNTTESGLDGGAIAMRGASDLINCAFLGNIAGRVGGAVCLDEGVAAAVNCMFAGNRARRVGGAIQNDGSLFEVINCAVVGNVCDLLGSAPHNQRGGALHNRNDGTLHVYNSLLWGNSARGDADEDAQLFHESGTLIIKRTNVQGWTGGHGGPHNSGDDPMFVDVDGPDDIFGTADDDLRLLADSPARDSGDNALLPRDVFDIDHDHRDREPVPLDLLGNKRVRHGKVDRGPIEHGS